MSLHVRIVVEEVEIVVSVPVEWSLGVHLGSDLELNSVPHWVSWVLDSLGVNHPSLVLAVVALVPMDVSVVRVGVSVYVKASLSDISDVSS